MKRLVRWLKEPLVHFLVLGGALFALHRLIVPPTANKEIVLSEAMVRGLRQDHLRRNGKLPTATEEAGLIQRFIDDEVLYREAVALGLDKGDIIVRRRLVQKMEFLTEGTEPIPQPTDNDLQTYLNAHADRYAEPARVTLTQVFIGSDRHGDGAPALVAHLREQLVNGADAAGLGDPFLRGRVFMARSETELAAIFGPVFAGQVMSLPIGIWSEPVSSSYGLHLVRVSSRTAAQRPSVAAVRAALTRDWREERRAAADRAALKRLRQQYDIRVEGTALAARGRDGS